MLMVKSAFQVHEMVKSSVLVHDLALHHLHDLPNESANAACPIIWCIVLHVTDSFSFHVHTFISHNNGDEVL